MSPKCYLISNMLSSIIASLLVYADGFTLTEYTVNEFSKLLKFFNSNGYTEKAIDLIYSKRHPSNGWSRSIGQKSPEMVERLELYQKLSQLIGYGRLRQIVDKCVDDLKKEIENDLIRDEEIFNPR